MEENIKLIKEKIKKSRELFAEVGSHIFLNEETIIAIEKLIGGYLEKEKECKEQYEWNIFYREEMGKKNIQIQNSIPKSEILEIIENHYPDVACQKIQELIEKGEK